MYPWQIATANLRMNSRDNTDHPNVIAPPPLIFLGCAALSGLIHYAYPLQVAKYPGLGWTGFVLAAISGSFAIWAVRSFTAMGTNLRPDRPAVALVRTGPYRFTRNPMYLSLCSLQLALGLILDLSQENFLALVLVLDYRDKYYRQDLYTESVPPERENERHEPD